MSYQLIGVGKLCYNKCIHFHVAYKESNHDKIKY